MKEETRVAALNVCGAILIFLGIFYAMLFLLLFWENIPSPLTFPNLAGSVWYFFGVTLSASPAVLAFCVGSQVVFYDY